MGSCLALGNELSEETHILTMQKTVLGWCPVESSRVGEPRRTAQLLARSLGFYEDGISFQIVFGQSFRLRVLLGSACIAQLRWMPVRGILGGGRTCDVSL